MARGGGGRGRKVVVNSGRWHTVTKTNTEDSGEDEVVAKKMTDADWQEYFQYMADVQVLSVTRGEPFLFFVLTLLCYCNKLCFSSILMKQIVHNSILDEIMSTYCPETSDSYERILAETKEWIQNHR